ncbi:hydroxyethylthiazole kinase [Rhodobacter aestuarii]|uniref:Hydroxyethylthiazole kinase n=1 Tax=Rhodobacter aestuarii TaxID=453582 RepID=A0A1N7J059_9RHOB|nr:hydroxyethylthiazole kinase [Rhodobacter aestuarii]PTV97325.1 hydroxyethylthiazole kinase [Rhodobacter aestuarii]SIS42758.1 hydroxyethylthiazole kinase [Rhodobacter aestuarii]
MAQSEHHDWGQHLAQMRATAPLVHNITNFVAMNVMANVQLAIGASPAMVHALEEVEEFAALAPVLTVNIGTADGAWAAGMLRAAKLMALHTRPWVLDPVGVGATAFRQELCAGLLALKPTVIRGNASEILALAGQGGQARGVDAGDGVAAAEAAARDLATRTGGVVAVSGPVDFVTSPTRAARVANGHALMPRVTALGCSLNGVIGAFLAGQPAFEATVAALAYYGLAGEQAGAKAQGPGSFQPAFLDALAALTPERLTTGAKVQIL